MTQIALLVEGRGDEIALPILLRKLIDWEKHYVEFRPIMRAAGKTDIISRFDYFLENVYKRQPDGFLILLDADEDCPVDLARSLAEQALKRSLSFPTAVVCANCEYEAWFLASMKTIAAESSLFDENLRYEGDVENLSDPKSWLTGHMRQTDRKRSYKETLHQASLSKYIDPALVRERSRSLRRLEHALLQLLEADEPRVTPVPEDG